MTRTIRSGSSTLKVTMRGGIRKIRLEPDRASPNDMAFARSNLSIVLAAEVIAQRSPREKQDPLRPRHSRPLCTSSPIQSRPTFPEGPPRLLFAPRQLFISELRLSPIVEQTVMILRGNKVTH